jgi:hypothetical protein
MPQVSEAAAPSASRTGAVLTGLVEVGVNFLLPFAVFILLAPRYGDARALLASSAPPIAWTLFELAWRRRVDALSLVVLAGIGLSLLAFAGGGGVTLLQLRERLITGIVGLVFLASAAIGRPLIYFLARASILRTSRAKAAHFESLREDAGFRRAMTVMTLAWGFALVAECAAEAALTLVVSVKAFLIVGPVVGYTALGLMLAWTWWYARRRIGPAMRAAAGDA